jgi:hypothetical protein
LGLSAGPGLAAVAVARSTVDGVAALDDAALTGAGGGEASSRDSRLPPTTTTLATAPRAIMASAAKSLRRKPRDGQK